MQPNKGEMSRRVCVVGFHATVGPMVKLCNGSPRVSLTVKFLYSISMPTFRRSLGKRTGSHRGLRETPLAATVAGILFFEEPVHGPLDVLAEILREEQTNFVGIGNFWAARFFFFLFSSPWRRWNFFVSNSADTEFVFREESWIERNLVPISKSPSCFQTHCLHAATAIKSFQLCFGRYVKTIGQTHFDLLSEKIIWRSVAESLTLKKFAEEKRPWWQHVGIYCIGKTAARKPGGAP